MNVFFSSRLTGKQSEGQEQNSGIKTRGTLAAVRAKFCSRFSVSIIRNWQGGRWARLGCLKGLECAFFVHIHESTMAAFYDTIFNWQGI